MARLGRGVYHRADGRYEARYIKEYNANGRAVYSAVYGKTAAEVKEKRSAVAPENPHPKPKQSPLAAMTISEALTAYIENSRAVIKPTTTALYERYIRSYISPHFGDLRCGKLSQEETQKFADKLIENGLSVQTVQSVLTFFKAGFRSEIDSKFVVKLPKQAKYEVEVLSIDEQKRLEQTAKAAEPLNYIGIMLSLYTGVRVGELCGLMWSDVDFESGRLFIKRTYQRIKSDSGDSKTVMAFLSPKSRSSERSIPLPKFLLEIFAEHKRDFGGEYVLSKNGSPIEPRNFQHRFKKLLKEAGICEKNLHITRHTFATRALENGFDIKMLSELLGHANASITLSRYAHCTDKHKRDKMESLTDVYKIPIRGQDSGQVVAQMA